VPATAAYLEISILNSGAPSNMAQSDQANIRRCS
jgi:hypothetical protein